MANLVNDASNNFEAMTPAQRKNRLYNSVSFRELYKYNGPIMSVRDISKYPFQKYIDEGVSKWRSYLQKSMPSTDLRIDTVGDNAYFTVALPMTDLREEDGQMTTDGETIKLHFAVLEIQDPVTGEYSTEGGFERLRKYVELGLYPVISLPMQEKDIYDNCEKYDSLCPEHFDGTIVDVVKEDLSNRVYAIVMWDPAYTENCESSMFYGSQSGVLVLTNMIRTPEPWRMAAEDFNGGIITPVFTYNPNVVMLYNISNSIRLLESINQSVVTGEIELDYVNFMISKLKAGEEKYSQALAKITELESRLKEVPTEDPGKESVEEDPVEPVAKPYDIPTEEFTKDDWARRMRLMDEAVPDVPSDSITGSLLETYRNEDEIGF